MEESYSETYLKAKPSNQRILARIGFIILCVVILFAGALTFNGIFGLFIAIIIDGVIFYFMPSWDIAYEYVFVDGQIDFDCIIGGKKRKQKKRTDLEKIDIIAPEGSHTLDQYKNLPLHDFSSGNKDDRHFIAISLTDKGKERIKFTPDEKLIENIKNKDKIKIEC